MDPPPAEQAKTGHLFDPLLSVHLDRRGELLQPVCRSDRRWLQAVQGKVATESWRLFDLAAESGDAATATETFLHDLVDVAREVFFFFLKNYYFF